MARSFPQNFDLRLLKGPRGEQFTKPEDAFQQLLGDALKEMAGPYAHISPTRGRDGSIDAFVVDGALLSGPFRDLALPLIVECKTHDDAARDIQKNILGQWAAMERKLEAHALAGWKDLFEPWSEARGYAYCVSSHIPNEQTRNKLVSSIETFFSSLPGNCRPPLDSIRVVDWSDLRQWLESYARLSDSWLGIELELILDHQTFLNRLSGFREYLLPSKLEFVDPPPDSSFHPAQILSELEKPESRQEVLLVGAGGIGKTRTAIEVGSLAVSEGWRVLHVLPDEPGVETEDIAEIVLPYANNRTLLVFDYIDQMQRLDLASLRRSLIPFARERGIQLRLLANCRPGWMQLNNPERDELFRFIELRPTEAHKTKLIQKMADRIAPTASRILGTNEVLRLCGTRAIIALLIARELEARALSNLLAEVDTAGLRSGDLVQWLRRRLEENALSVKSEAPSLVPKRPEAPMVAAATALACAPERRETLVLAAESAYRSLEWLTPTEDARFLVDLLLKSGWLESHGLFDATPHDVVADEVLDQTIHSEAITFERELTAVLSSAFTIPRALGRLANAFRRILGFAKNEEVNQSISVALQNWLSANAIRLGNVLQVDDPDLTGYALGALLSGPPWEAPAIEAWEHLFLPWLSAHSTKEEARHLLYKGLKSVHFDQARLIEPALIWLDSHGLALAAQFVLRALLERSDLEGEEARTARRFALRWLTPHHPPADARFVLRALLERSDLEGEEAKTARRFALRWLTPHHATAEARFVLKAVLNRSDLEGEEARTARGFALQWLEPHQAAPEADFVLNALLDRSDLEGEEAKTTRRFALNWLETHHPTLGAEFVLTTLLARSDLEHEEAKTARGFALNWLKPHHPTLEAEFVLKALLDRSDLEDKEATAARIFALQWLVPHHATLEAGFVLAPLLNQSPVGVEVAPVVLDRAVKWLQTFYETTDAEFVLSELFRRDDVPETTQNNLMMSAISRLRLLLENDEATFLLRTCLKYRINNDRLQRNLLLLAMIWLELHPDSPNGEYVWNRVLRYRPNLLSDGDWSAVARHALRWLKARNLNEKGVEQTTNSLLMRSQCLDTGESEYLIKLATQLLRTNLHPAGRRKMVASIRYIARFLAYDDPLRNQIEEVI